MKELIMIMLFCFTLISCQKEESAEEPDAPISEWARLEDLQPNLRLNAAVLTYGQKAYLFPGSGSYRYSSEAFVREFSNGVWNDVIEYPGEGRAGNMALLQHQDEAYLIGGTRPNGSRSSDIYKYNFEEETMFLHSTFPVKGGLGSSYCSTSTKGYVWVAHTSENEEDLSGDMIYEMDFESEEWHAMSSPIPTTSEGINATRMSSIGDDVFLVSISKEESNHFMFNPESETWRSLADFPGEIRSKAILFASDRYLYLGFGLNWPAYEVLNDLWKYDPVADTWEEMTYPGSGFHGGFGFFLNNQLFLGGGVNETIIDKEVMNPEFYRF